MVNNRKRGVCSLPDCERPHSAKGYCRLHWDRWRKTGRTDTSVEWHGLSDTPTHGSWQAMKTRCFNENNYHYKNWGARGVTVCERWKNSFLNFYNDMGEKPEGKSLDRMDNDGNYSCGKCEQCIENGWPMNCRWATAAQQSENRRHVLSGSGYKGVYRIDQYGYAAYTSFTRKERNYIGYFKTAEEAHKARIKALDERA